MVRLIECVTDELSPNWNSKAFELNCLELIIMFESLYFTLIYDYAFFENVEMELSGEESMPSWSTINSAECRRKRS